MPEKNQTLFDEVEENSLTVPSERRTRSSTPLDGRPTRRKSDISLSTVAEAAMVPQKRKRKANERDREKDLPKSTSFQRVR